jgi:hypothetical protein
VKVILSMLAAALSTSAQAQDSFTVHPDFLHAEAGTWYDSGLGAPSVAWDRDRARFVMVFESMTAPPDERCPEGAWSLGLAQSADGHDWSVRDAALVVPSDGTHISCGARHPALLKAGGTWHVWFTSLQAEDACAAAEPRWGCTTRPGIGHAQLGAGGARLTEGPVLVGEFAQPTVIGSHGQLEMLVVDNGDLLGAVSSDGRTWSIDTADNLNAGVTSWALSELYSPVLLCDDRDDYEYTLYFGGQTWGADAMESAGWGRAVSDEADFWFIDPMGAFFEYVDEGAWLDFDVVQAGEHALMWFSELDELGRPQIGRATTTEAWDPATLSDRMCL